MARSSNWSRDTPSCSPWLYRYTEPPNPTTSHVAASRQAIPEKPSTPGGRRLCHSVPSIVEARTPNSPTAWHAGPTEQATVLSLWDVPLVCVFHSLPSVVLAT